LQKCKKYDKGKQEILLEAGNQAGQVGKFTVPPSNTTGWNRITSAPPILAGSEVDDDFENMCIVQ